MDVTIYSKLQEIVGKKDIATDAYERALYSHDAAPIPRLLSFLFKTTPDAIVRPESAEEIAQILRLSYDCGAPVVPRGAASYALGGVTPAKGGIVLDLVKLNKIGELSVDEAWVEVEAGVVFKDLMDYLSDKGLSVYCYPTSAPSATVGGWVSTGGYGIGSLKYGPIWEQVKELAVVTPTGEILKVPKDSAYPKIEWFFGTEGQLGVITKVKLGIRQKPEKLSVRGVYVTGHKEIAELAAELSNLSERPYLLIIMDSDLVVLKNTLSERKLEDKNLVLTAFEGSLNTIDSAVRPFDQIIEQRTLDSMDEGLAEAELEELFFPMRIGRLGPTLLAGEVIVPMDKLNPVLDKIKSLQKKHKLTIGIEAQAISNDSVLLLAMYLADERKAIKYITRLAFIKDIISIGLSHGGKPYGTGLWASVYVKQRFGKEYLKELKSAKSQLDPKGIMNPGKFFKARTRFGISINRVLYNLSMKILGFVRRFR